MNKQEFFKKWRFIESYCFPGEKKKFLESEFMVFSNSKKMRLLTQAIVLIIVLASIIIVAKITLNMNLFLYILFLVITIALDFIIITSLLTALFPIKCKNKNEE